ncbi:MAG: hypothetical protein EP307_03210 [Rhodobacteraceae bacterium]|nr:MAG: hypothetical protein EP307_03210 [Paracoccaceae bacterium]
MMRFVFDCHGYTDARDDMDQTLTGVSGRSLMQAVRSGLKRQGYACGPVRDEDWGWFFRAERGGRRYLCGGSLEGEGNADAGDTQEASVFIQPERGLADRLRGLNRPDPDDPACADLRKVLAELPKIEAIVAL